MTPDWNWRLYATLTFVLATLIFLGRQHIHQPVKPMRVVSEPADDAMGALHGGELLAVTQAAEIDSLKQELHDVELTSRSVGLVQYKPTKWRNGWVATFYDGSKGLNGTGTGITASGVRASNGWSVAADTNILPLGTVIEISIPGQPPQLAQVQDRGSAIKGRRLDIYIPNYAEDMKLGRERVRIRVMEAVK